MISRGGGLTKSFNPFLKAILQKTDVLPYSDVSIVIKDDSFAKAPAPDSAKR